MGSGPTIGELSAACAGRLWAVWAVAGPCKHTHQRETTLTDGRSFPLVSALQRPRSGGLLGLPEDLVDLVGSATVSPGRLTSRDGGAVLPASLHKDYRGAPQGKPGIVDTGARGGCPHVADRSGRATADGMAPSTLVARKDRNGRSSAVRQGADERPKTTTNLRACSRSSERVRSRTSLVGRMPGFVRFNV